MPDAKTLADRMRLLDSKDPTEVLSALVFLGGRHMDDRTRMRLPEPHRGWYADLFQQLIGDKRIQDRVQRLEKSHNAWISQAAALAARPADERPWP